MYGCPAHCVFLTDGTESVAAFPSVIPSLPRSHFGGAVEKFAMSAAAKDELRKDGKNICSA